MLLFEILMFPWAASCRAIRANGIAAIGLPLLLLATRLLGNIADGCASGQAHDCTNNLPSGQIE
jgi:hypothetical protein